MFSGAGVVAKGDHSASMRCRKRETGLGLSATHVQIFYNLGPGRVHFDSSASLVYFVDCPEPNIRELLAPVFKGLGQRPSYEQLFLDDHKLLKGAVLLPLPTPSVAAVLAALRLSSIDLSIA